MKKFYLIPINSSKVLINKIDLIEYLKKNYLEIYQLYSIKSDLIRGRKHGDMLIEKLQQERFDTNNKQIEILSQHYQVPLYLIAYGNDNIVKEVFTDVEIDINNSVSVRKIEGSKVLDFLDLEYSNRVRGFLNFLPKKFIDTDDSLISKRRIISTITYLCKEYNVDSIVDNDQRLDYVTIFLIKYNLNVIDFAILSDVYLKSDKNIEYEQSELIMDLKQILNIYGLDKSNIKIKKKKAND